MMLELGLKSVKYCLMKKRLMYLFHLITSPDDLLSKQILLEQVKSPLKSDWWSLVSKDMEHLNIKLTLSKIGEMTKKNFKQLVNTKCESSNLKFLLERKSKLSKGKEICYAKLETQKYLKAGNGLSPDNMRWIYALRCRSLPLKCNAPSQHSNIMCLAPGCAGEDREVHVYSCQLLSNKNELTQNNLEFSKIFSSGVSDQLLVMNVFKAKNDVNTCLPIARRNQRLRRKSNLLLGAGR